MQRITLYLLLLMIYCDQSAAQKFPEELRMSQDEKQLVTGKEPYAGFYESTVIHTINIQFSGTTYWTTLTNNFPNRTDLSANVTIDGTLYPNCGVRFKGNSSYSAIGTADKKSFNISLDDFVAGQNVGGYNTVVLNNSFDDPSFMREVFYEQRIAKHIPSPKGNFAHLYINGQDWGIYDNVEQLNHDYEKEWFFSHDGALWRARNPLGAPQPHGGNGDSLCSLYNFGTDTNFYKQHYTLKSSGVPNPFTKLMTLIQVLDTVSPSNVYSVLGNYLDVDRALWFIASENAFADDDSYLFKGRKDYYMYYEPETGRMTTLEMDGNDAMDPTLYNLDIFFNANNANFPLVKKLLNAPAIRERYLAHMRTLVEDEFVQTECDSIIDAFDSMIAPLVQSDPKKLYTYADYQNEVPVLKTFMSTRRNYIQNNAEINVPSPVITNVAFSSHNVAWMRPQFNEDTWVTANVSCANGLSAVNLYSSVEIVGKFTSTAMFDDGAHHDQAAGDGIFGAKINAQPGATWVRFYIEAVANTAAKTVAYSPVGAEHDVYTYLVLPAPASDTSVVINEVMSKNISTVADSAGEFEDWIELYNTSGQSKDISGYYFSDKKYNLIKWKIPAGTILPPHSYKIFWADENESQGADHTNFKLSSTNGETVQLLNSNDELVDEVQFGSMPADKGFARIPNGTGNFMIQSPTFNSTNSVGVIAIINAQVSSGCSPLGVQFTNNSLNSTSYAWDFGDGTSPSTLTSPSHFYSSPGNYVVKLAATGGLVTDTGYFNIIVFPNPVVNFGTDTINTISISYVLDPGAGFVSFSWSTGETTQTINVGTDGGYCVSATDTNGCVGVGCVYVNVDLLGVAEIGKNKISLYPNPANENISLNTIDERMIHATIVNNLGETIYSCNFSKNIVIDTEKWPDGIYFLRTDINSLPFILCH